MAVVIFFLFLLIFAEGYVVLATELLAIRLTVPMVGAGTDTVAVIIAGVLMPLAFGYYAGGNYYLHQFKKRRKSIRQKLLWNMVVAGLILSFGLSMVVIEPFFTGLAAMGIHNRIVETAFYAGIFIVYPVFLLGQTIPLASNFFAQKTLSQMTGRMLAFSTLGSFSGSILTTIVLMTTIGVHNTVIFNLSLLVFMIWALSKPGQLLLRGLAILIFITAFGLNNDYVIGQKGVVSNNRYSTIKIATVDDRGAHGRVLILNNSYSAAYSDTEGALFDYVKYINRHFVLPITGVNIPPKDILLLGGGGFTIGIMDHKNNYTYVDIDPDIKNVAEKYLLRYKIGPNKKFVPEDARGFIRQNTKKYDLIVLDSFSAIKAVPEYLITREYFAMVKESLKDNGVVVMNFIICPNFEDVFSVRLDNTIRSVFPQINRVVVGPANFSVWKDYRNNAGDCTANVEYSAILRPATTKDNAIYSDNMNTSFLDKGKKY